MKIIDRIVNSLLRTIVALTLMMECHGIGRSMSSINNALSQESQEALTLSTNDSILQEIGFIVSPDVKLDRQKRKRIENRLSHLPHRIVRRDTTRYFLQTALATAYYEFAQKDYKRALSFVDEFYDKTSRRNIVTSWLRYSAVGINASFSIREKGKIKGKKDPNSWFTPIKTDYEISFQRNEMNFLDDLIDDIPLDGNLSVYLALLKAYHDLNGKLAWLNSYSTNPGFFQKCKNLGREDILSGIYDIWGITQDGFQYNRQNRQIAYVDTTLKPGTAFLLNTEIKIPINPHIFDSLKPEWNRIQVDSLISIGKAESISQPLHSLLNLTYYRHNYTEVIRLCGEYEKYCPEDTRLSLYNHWGLAETFTGKYDNAIMHFDEALKHSNSKSLTLLLQNSKACALGEAGKYREAIDLFNSIRNLQNTPFDRFCWNDNLGYVYSYVDPETALAYYNNAEHYLDNGLLYAERKIQHFCRKAHVLTCNPYLQRQAIENAMQYTRNEFPDTISIGVANTELGAYYNSLKDYDKANECFRTAEKCFMKLVPEDRRVSHLKLLQAENIRESGKFEEAYRILHDLYSMQSAMLDDGHPELLPTIRELCATLCEMNAPMDDLDSLYNVYVKLRDSQPQYNSKYEDIILDIKRAQSKGEMDKAVCIVLHALDSNITPFDRLKLSEELEAMVRNNDSYKHLMTGIVQSVKKNVIMSLLAVDSNDATSASNPVLSITNSAISQLKEYDEDCDNALALSLFRKGLLFSTKTAVKKIISSNRHMRPKLKRLNEMRNELNFAIAFSDENKTRDLIPAISSLERELNHSAISDKNLFSSIDKTVEQVTRNLHSSDAAIDFVHYEKGLDHYYGAFIIRRNEKPIFINLFADDGTVVDGNKIWAKLLPYLSETGENYFSTDGKLNAMDIEFLSPDDGDIMCRRYNLHRVFHLADVRKPATINIDFTIVGVSDHNSPVGEGEPLDRGAWTDLPNVKYEIGVIDHQLKGMSHTIFYNDDARESAIKALDGSGISVLHFSTHGFYRDRESLQTAVANADHFDHNIATRMLRNGKSEISGLVLRGGNQSWRSPEILDDEDDLLTSDEIEVMNFPELKLVVLSACETGLGETDAEGVWGLQRAFRIAGCKSLICALRKVDDYWTAQFMEELYKNAANGMTVYDSFHSARNTLSETPECPREMLNSFILIE